jgi:toxin ParE1/3/4
VNPAVRYSRLAESDLDEIANYTIQRWGAAQATRYLSELEDCCEGLTKNPGLGRGCDSLRAGLRRMEHGSHVIFFATEESGILVVRILHKSMAPGLHELEP